MPKWTRDFQILSISEESQEACKCLRQIGLVQARDRFWGGTLSLGMHHGVNFVDFRGGPMFSNFQVHAGNWFAIAGYSVQRHEEKVAPT